MLGSLVASGYLRRIDGARGCGLSRLPTWCALAFALAAAGCFDKVTAPSCRLLSDCPAGYVSCEDGYCFTDSACTARAPVAGDLCCAETDGDRSADTDCLTLDAPLSAVSLTCPATGDDGTLWVAGTSLAGGANVRVWQVSPKGVVARAVQVGPGAVTLPALLTAGGSLYAAYPTGVVRYKASDLTEADVAIPTLTPPVGGLVAGTGGSGTVVAWPTADSPVGHVFLYDEDQKTFSSHEGGATGDAFAPFVTAAGDSMFVMWKSGVLVRVAFSGKVGLAGKVALETGETAIGPPVEVGGTVWAPLRRLDGSEGFAAWTVDAENLDLRRKQNWTLALDGAIAGRPLVDSVGYVVVAYRDGKLALAREVGDVGSYVATGDFGTSLADLAPLLMADGRVVAIAEGGKTVVSLNRIAGASGPAFKAGMRFDLQVEAVTSPALAAGRLAFGTAAHGVIGYVFPGFLAAVGFPKDGGDAGNTGRAGAL